MPAKLPCYDIINERKKTGQTLVVVPVYNEMPHLADVIRVIRMCWDGDILAIDDNSSDNSLCLLKMVDTISVIHNRRNAGAGGVLLQGFKWASLHGYKYVITLDADGQHNPILLKEFMHCIGPHCCGKCHCKIKSDFVWGSRYIKGHGNVGRSFQSRQEVNKIITRRLNEITGYKLTDAFCGFRAYSVKALNKLDLTETGYGMFMQMTVQAARAGIKIKELPVPLVYLDETRDFNNEFSDSRERLTYYNSVIDKELGICCRRK